VVEASLVYQLVELDRVESLRICLDGNEWVKEWTKNHMV
jgi:hypothetical protein